MKLYLILIVFCLSSCFSVQNPKLTKDCNEHLNNFNKLITKSETNNQSNYIPINQEVISSVPSECWIGLEKEKLFEIIPFQNIEIKHFKDRHEILVFPAEKSYNIFIVNSLTFIIRDEKVDDAYFVYRN